MLSVNHLIGFGAGGSNLTLYEAIASAGLTTNLELVLDAGDGLSYVSGQSWLDRSGNGFDFFLGADGSATSTDPTFNGSPGGRSSADYFSLDGGDYFRYDTTNETWMQNLHKNNAILTIVAVIYVPAHTAEQGILGNSNASGNDIGANFYVDPTEKLRFRVTKGSAPVVLDVVADSALSTGAWHFVAVSLNEATGAGGGFFYRDGAYDQASAADTFTSTYASPSSSNASFTTEIGGLGNGSSLMASGARIAALGAWEGTALSKANLDTLFALLRSRWGL